MAGVPWFAEGSSGAVGASFGYILGMLLASAAVGALARRGADRSVLRMAGTMLLGEAIIYAIGVPYLALAAGMSRERGDRRRPHAVPARRRPEGGPGDGRAADGLEVPQPLTPAVSAVT